MGCGSSAKYNAAADESTSGPVIKAQTGAFEEIEVKYERPTNTYDVGKKALGQGGFGKVTAGKKKGTNEHRAIKQLPKADTESDQFQSELVISCKLDHPNIVKIFEVFADRQNYYLVMELASGGELFDAIVAASHFDEGKCAHVMHQVMRGIFYMHTKGVCHRDVKAENFLLQDKTDKKPIEQCVIKIIDFGIAMQFEPGEKLTGSSGTPYYIAPEVLEGPYDCVCDEWACGVLMYIMLAGIPPFHGLNNQAILKKVQAGLPSAWKNTGCWQNISDSAKDLVQKLICLNPRTRITAEQSLAHTWLKQAEKPYEKQASLQEAQLQSLKEFSCQTKLKKAALHAIARRMNDKDIAKLKETFEALDKNHDGVVTFLELQAGVSQLPDTSADVIKDLSSMMTELDVDGSQSIDYTEFIAGTLSKRQFQEEQVLWSAFSVFDKDGSGKINRTELEAVFKSGDVQDVMGKKLEAIEMAMKKNDSNGDDQIDFKEFIAMMRH